MTKSESSGFQSEINLFVKGRSYLAGNYLFFFCWKVILLYGDTCYLILRRGLEFGKVGKGGGGKGEPMPTETQIENF